jgi:hypothetical protein
MHRFTASFCTARHRAVHILCRSYRTDRKFLFDGNGHPCPSFKFLFNGNGHPCPSFECMDTHVSSLFQQHPYLQMDISMSLPLLNVAPNNMPFHQCHLLNVALNNSPICQWTFQPNLPMDISVSFPLLNVAPSDSLIRSWTSQCPFLF